MSRTHQETMELHRRALSTMGEVLEGLYEEEPDPAGTFAELAFRIEADRGWVRMVLALGEEPVRPAAWLRRTRGRAA